MVVTSALVTSWCLTQATLVQKNDPRNDRATLARVARMSTDFAMAHQLTNQLRKNRNAMAATKPHGKTLPPQKLQTTHEKQLPSKDLK
jgi:hypothetical protein